MKKLVSIFVIVSMLCTYMAGIPMVASAEDVTADTLLNEDFNNYKKGAVPTGAFVVNRAGDGDMSIVDKPDDKNKSLCLSCGTTGSAYIEKFVENPENVPLSLKFRFMLENLGSFDLVTVRSRYGEEAKVFNVADGKLMYNGVAVAEFTANRWYSAEILFNTTGESIGIIIDGDKVIKKQKITCPDIVAVRLQLSDCSQKICIDDLSLKRADTVKRTTEFAEESPLVLSNVIETEAEDIASSGLLMYRNMKRAVYYGEILKTDTAAIEIDTVFYLPVRFVGETLGAEVVWNAEENVTFLVYKDKTYKLKEGESTVCADGTPVELSSPIVNKNGALYMSASDLTKLMDKRLLIYNCLVMIDGEEALFTAADERVRTAFLNYVKYERPTGKELYQTFTSRWKNNEHPRIMGTKADFDRVRKMNGNDPFVTKLVSVFEAKAEEYINKPVPVHSSSMSEQDEAIQLGCQILGFMYQLTGDERYAKRCLEQMQAAIAFPDWNHKVSFLTTGQIIGGMGMGYDLIYDYMTPEQRQEIVDGTMKLGLSHALKSYTGEYSKGKGNSNTCSWVTDKYNFNPACNGGVLYAVFAMAESIPAETEMALGYAFRSYEKHLNEYEPDGAWTEGPDYGYVTLNMNALLIGAIENVLGSDYGFASVPGFKEAAYYQEYILGPIGFFNYSDANKQVNPEHAFAFFLARHLDDPALGYYRYNTVMSPTHRYTSETLPQELIWYDPSLVADSVDTLDKDKTFRTAETSVMRSAWDDDGIFLAAHAHDNGADHGQLDTGTFFLDAYREPWFIELGYDPLSYTADGAGHVTYRSRAEGHNTIVIDNSKYVDYPVDENQRVYYKKYDFEDMPLGDITQAEFRIYKNEAGLATTTIAEEDGNKFMRFKYPVAEPNTHAMFEIYDSAPYVQHGVYFKMKVRVSSIIEGIFNTNGAWNFFEIQDRAGHYNRLFYLTQHGWGTISADGWLPLVQPGRDNMWYTIEAYVDIENDTYDIGVTDGDNTVSYKNLPLQQPLDNLWVYNVALKNSKTTVDYDDIEFRVDSRDLSLVTQSTRRYDQNPRSKSYIDEYVSKPQGSYSIIDTTVAYKDWASSAKRGIGLFDQRRGVMVRDEITLKENADVYWFAHTHADNKIVISEDGKSAVIHRNGKKMWAGIISDDDLKFHVMKCQPLDGSPNPSQQQANTEYQKLAIKAENVGKFDVTVAIVPLLAGEEAPRSIPKDAPLSEWSVPDEELPKVDSITVDGKLIDMFSPEKNVYDVLLPEGTRTAPAVEATAKDAKVTVTPPAVTPGYTLITVEKDGLTAEYIVSFRVDDPIMGTIQGYTVSANDLTSSGHEGANYGPDKMIDDNFNTRLCSLGRNHWVQVDFKKQVSLTKLQIAWYYAIGRNYNFDIQFSDDAKNWTTVYSGQSSGETEELETFEFGGPKEGRYMRILCKGYGEEGQYNNITEIR